MIEREKIYLSSLSRTDGFFLFCYNKRKEHIGYVVKGKGDGLMRKIVVDMQNFLFADSIATAFRNSDYEIDVIRTESPKDIMLRQTAAALQRALPKYFVRTVTIADAEAKTQIERLRPDFLFAPASFSGMTGVEAARIATRRTNLAQSAERSVGAVFAVRADSRFQSLADLRGRRVFAGLPTAIDGWLAAARELRQQGQSVVMQQYAIDFSYGNLNNNDGANGYRDYGRVNWAGKSYNNGTLALEHTMYTNADNIANYISSQNVDMNRTYNSTFFNFVDYRLGTTRDLSSSIDSAYSDKYGPIIGWVYLLCAFRIMDSL